MNKALFPGSFDPITIGHENLIKRAAEIFDHLVIAVACNPNKKTLFTLDERINLIKLATQELPNVSIVGFSDLTINYLKQNQIKILLRGLRNSIDYEYEKQLGDAYLSQMPELEIIYLNSRMEYSFISSTLVKEVASHNGTISSYVSSNTEKALKSKFLK